MADAPKMNAFCVVAAGGTAWVVMVIPPGSVMNRAVEGLVILSVSVVGEALK